MVLILFLEWEYKYAVLSYPLCLFCPARGVPPGRVDEALGRRLFKANALMEQQFGGPGA